MNYTKARLTSIVNRYADMIVRIAFGYFCNLSDAEDIMQEVFIALMESKKIDDEEKLKAWLITVTINKCKNILKSSSRKNLCLDMSIFPDNNPYSYVLQQLDLLEDDDRTVLFLYYYEGYSAKEIGTMLGKTENTIHARLSRARGRLKEILEETL